MKDGWISPESDADWLDEDRAEDERLFVSFAGLGASGKPSEKTILSWVRRYGLLWREKDNPEHDTMYTEDFCREVLFIRQMLVLYEAAQTQNPDVLNHLPAAGGVGGWRYTLPTEIDTNKRTYGLEIPDRSLAGAWDLFRLALQEKMKDVRPTFAVSAEPADDSKFRQAWYCRDLLSAIYLSFYLFATGGNPVGYCQACGQPMKLTRSDKRYCNPTCRSNARHRRNRE